MFDLGWDRLTIPEAERSIATDSLMMEESEVDELVNEPDRDGPSYDFGWQTPMPTPNAHTIEDEGLVYDLGWDIITSAVPASTLKDGPLDGEFSYLLYRTDH